MGTQNNAVMLSIPKQNSFICFMSFNAKISYKHNHNGKVHCMYDLALQA